MKEPGHIYVMMNPSIERPSAFQSRHVGILYLEHTGTWLWPMNET